jgi:hypothetical protein
MTRTNLQRERMRTLAGLTLFSAGGYTNIFFLGAHALQAAFASLEPIFGAMIQSCLYRVEGGSQWP